MENSLFGILRAFSPMQGSSKYVVGVKGTALQFAASVSKRKLSARFIAMTEMVAYSAQILGLPKTRG